MLKQGGTDEQDELTRLRTEKEAGEFWSGVFEEITDKTEREKIEAELHDYKFVMSQVPEVYLAITGQKMSKCNYYASGVISEFEQHTNDLIDSEMSDLLEPLKIALGMESEWDHCKVVKAALQKIEAVES